MRNSKIDLERFNCLKQHQNNKKRKKEKRVFNNMHGSALQYHMHEHAFRSKKRKYKQKHQRFTQDVLTVITIIKIIIKNTDINKLDNTFFCLKHRSKCSISKCYI